MESPEVTVVKGFVKSGQCFFVLYKETCSEGGLGISGGPVKSF